MAKNTLTTAFYQTEKDLKHPIPIRAYKDRIFRMIFKEKRALLALYNAMNDTAYQDPEELVITTLENAIYLGMKNDVSFMICDRLFLYEHQSTKNPNMPLRNLLYVADLYSVLTKDMFLYGELPVAIPEPRFVVFYNGEQKMEERSVLRLSDLYRPRTEHPYLELETLVLNRSVENDELMSKIMKNSKNLILNLDLNENLQYEDSCNVISYGYSSKSDITVSSVEEDELLICVQHTIKSMFDKVIEPQEIKVNVRADMNVYNIMIVIALSSLYAN